MMSFKIPIIGSFLEGFAAEFKDKIRPIPGCVLKCDLAGGVSIMCGSLCHTGIYLGENRIVEVVPGKRKAKVQIVDPYDFLNGQGTNFIRTGINVYVATDGEGNALGSQAIADRAMAYSKRESRGEYDLVDNNCHKFTVRCITGEEPEDAKLSESDVEDALESVFGCDQVTWEPTGFGAGDMSFDDVDYDDEDPVDTESNDCERLVDDEEARRLARRDLEQMERELDDPDAGYVVTEDMDIKRILSEKPLGG